MKIINPYLRYYAEAADKLGIEYSKISKGMILFKGEKRNWSIAAAETDLCGINAKRISSKKDLTHKVLKEAGFSVPAQQVLKNEDDAIDFFNNYKDIVIKPSKGVGGKGITLLPRDKESISEALKIADNGTPGNIILGEEFFKGNHYRILVLGDKVIAAVLRKPSFVIGNGKDTIETLINAKNEEIHRKGLKGIPLDEATSLKLELDGLNLQNVPSDGEEVIVRLNTNISTGGTSEECLAEVHPRYLDIAVKATKALGLRFSGVDLMAKDITSPDAEYAINEINHHPGLQIHYKVSKGAVVDVAFEIMKYLQEFSQMEPGN